MHKLTDSPTFKMVAELEEKLREAACFGDIDGVKELLARNVNVNAQHDINGWTALHWAAKRNHLNIVNLLCNHGADKNIPTNKGEVAAQLTGEGVIKVLLNAMKGGAAGGRSPSPPPPKNIKKELPITPNYIRDPVLGYKVDLQDKNSTTDTSPRFKEKRQKFNNYNSYALDSSELILKIRQAGTDGDQDFIEIELPRDALTLEYLTVMGCEELGLEPKSIDRVRKMPNTRLRRNKEVERLEDYQEIEFVVRSEVQEIPNCNGDQVQGVEGAEGVQGVQEGIHQEVAKETDTATEETNADTEPEEMEQADN